jgi:hypothetical protein
MIQGASQIGDSFTVRCVVAMEIKYWRRMVSARQTWRTSGSGQRYPKCAGAGTADAKIVHLLYSNVPQRCSFSSQHINTGKMDTAAQIQPTDQQIYVEQPNLRRGKLCVYTTFALRPKCILTSQPMSRLVQLKSAHNWTLSGSRLKKLLAENNLKR